MRVAAIALLTVLLAAGSADAQGTQNPSFNLVNHASAAIKELYVTPAGDERWGRNRLREPLRAGSSFAVRRRIDGNCIFDIRVVYADNRIEDRRGVDSCKVDDVVVGAAARKAGDDPSFRLVNRGDQDIVELYATPAGSGHWGQNRLDTPLQPHAQRPINIVRESSCRFDLKLVLADHHAREKHEADLCRITDLPFP